MSRLQVIVEGDFLAQVTEFAELRGWSWAHWRPARTLTGWRTAVQGPLGKGFPDLILVRDESIMFVELKRDGAKPSLEQQQVLVMLARTHVDVKVWRPADWEEIEKYLR